MTAGSGRAVDEMAIYFLSAETLDRGNTQTQISPLNATSSGLLSRNLRIKNLEYINAHRGTKPPPPTGSQRSETEIRPRSRARTCVINVK